MKYTDNETEIVALIRNKFKCTNKELDLVFTQYRSYPVAMPEPCSMFIDSLITGIEIDRQRHKEKDLIFKWLFTFKRPQYKIGKLYDKSMKTMDNDLVTSFDYISFKGTHEYSDKVFSDLMENGVNIRDTHNLGIC